MQRKTLSNADKSHLDQAIGRHLLAWCTDNAATLLGVYAPMRGEPDLHPAFAQLHAQGVRLALPTVVSDDAPLKFVEWTPGEAMQQDRLGVSIPAMQRAEVFPPALVIPCVGFNAQHFRLGYGGGFYDRTVARVPRPATVGIAYAFSLVEFEAESFDVPMDCILTENGRFTAHEHV